MTELRTLVSFKSSAFNVSNSSSEYINEQNYGDDLALTIRSVLMGMGWQVDELGQEDHGWYFAFGEVKTDHTLVVGHVSDTPDEWMAWVERDAGFISSLFGGRQKGIQRGAVEAVHAALSNMPEIKDLSWSYPRREEDASPSP
jgi:hypothetical protein